MKTFRTVGSGASQTLEKIENNKIPVYETKAAAEADIANLSDGQIIGTKDEGNENAKPVDVVEKGNMHAVTSNAVADSLSYSTQEVKTGGKWIDGKPIYRKAVEVSSLPNNTQISYSHDIVNVDSFVTVRGIAKSKTLSLPIPFVERNGTTNIQIYAQASSFDISTNYDASSYACTIILEYTKTTD